MTSNNFNGFNGFTWFFAEVVDVLDPQELGRIRVRPYGIYSVEIPVEDLPWAICIQNVTSASKDKVGISPTGVEVGSIVFGFFADGEDVQQPIVVGSYAGVDDVSELVTGTDLTADSKSKNQIEDEPSPSYGAKYPHNKVISTASGHFIEIDDTEGSERLHVFHKSGSYHEIQTSGIMISKSMDDQHILSSKNLKLRAVDTIKMDAADGDINIENTLNVDAKTVNETAEGKYTIKGGTVTVSADGTLSIKGATVTVEGIINLKGTVAVTGGAFTYNGLPVRAGSITG